MKRLRHIGIGKCVVVDGCGYRCIEDTEGFACWGCDLKRSDGCFELSCAKAKRKDRKDVVFKREVD